jgi:hydrogenase nickel incorporation protein HypA/HybF
MFLPDFPVGTVVAALPLKFQSSDPKAQNVHELSFAENIIDIIHQSVPADELESVRIVRMKIGALSGVVPDSLEFCFSAISAQTQLAQARLEIEQIPFTVLCNSCRKTFVSDIGFMVCPDCGGAETTVVSGTELQVSEIELDTEEEKTS